MFLISPIKDEADLKNRLGIQLGLSEEDAEDFAAKFVARINDDKEWDTLSEEDKEMVKSLRKKEVE